MCDEDILEEFSALSINGEDVSGHKIAANCRAMCPQSEMIFRERNGLLHRLELIDPNDWDQYRATFRGQKGFNRRGNQHQQNQMINPNKQFTNQRKAVKQFKRSSAGQNLLHSNEIRPSEVLRGTVDYLLTDLLRDIPGILRGTSTLLQFGYYYDFTFDRLRSVRQDMVVQRIADDNCFYILEKCVDFYVHSHYLWQHFQSTRSKNDLGQLGSSFNPHLNQVHLYECLALLLRYYDHFEDTVWSRHRPLYESMFFILNLEANKSALSRYQQLKRSAWSRDLFVHELIRISGRVIVSHLLGNYMKCLRLAVAQFRAHPLFCLTFYISNLPHLHLGLLKLSCIAFRSVNTSIPLTTMADWFTPSYQSQPDCLHYLEDICTHFQIPLETTTSSSATKPKKPKSYDYFSFNCSDEEEEEEEDEPTKTELIKKMLITKKFPNIDQWRFPEELHPIGWFPRLNTLYRIFQ